VNSLEIHRKAGRYPLQEAAAIYRQHGIVVFKEYLKRDTQAPLRAMLESKVGQGAQQAAVLHLKEYPKADFLLGDVLAVRELASQDHVFFTRECTDAIKALLGTQELVYWGDSSIQFGEAARGFHKDNVDRGDGTKDDWVRDYELVRCGFYFQDHAKHSGGLKVRLGSHNIPNHLQGPIADISTQYGDLVIWNMRLTHSGNNRKLRFPSSVALHPRLEERLPSFLAAPEQMRRIATFCSFGKPGSHLDRYIDKMNAREKDYKPYFQFARKPSEAAAILAKCNVGFRRPNDYYAEFD